MAQREAWETRLQRIAAAVRNHRSLATPDMRWLSRQRQSARTGNLDHERTRLLHEHGLDRSLTEVRFDELIEHLDRFIAEYGHADVPWKYQDPNDGYPLGQRVQQIRDRNLRGILSEYERITLERRPTWRWQVYASRRRS